MNRCSVAARRGNQQGSQILGTPSSGRALGVRRCSFCRSFCSTSALSAGESCVGVASLPGFSSSRSHGGRSSKVGCRWPIGASSCARVARDHLAGPVTLVSEEGSPIARTTGLISIIARRETVIIDGRIGMVLLCVFLLTKDVYSI